MWDCARERAGITDSVWFKGLRALGATDAAKAGTHIKEIQTPLANTSSKTREIYIKESVPETSEFDLKLPWKSVEYPSGNLLSMRTFSRYHRAWDPLDARDRRFESSRSDQ